MTTARIAIDRVSNAPARTAAKPARRKATAATVPEATFAPTTAEFAELYNEYFTKVFAYVYGRVQEREVSLDVVSDVFEKAFVKVRSLRSRDAFGSWLFTIARNAWMDDRRRAKIRNRSARRLAVMAIQDSAPPDSALSRDDEVAAVLEAMDALPERQRDVLFLSALEGLSHAQIASVLAISSGAVKSNLSLARGRVADAVDHRKNESPCRAEVGS